jgi:hypothetical protein
MHQAFQALAEAGVVVVAAVVAVAVVVAVVVVVAAVSDFLRPALPVAAPWFLP